MNVLDSIWAAKRQEVARLRSRTSLAELRSRAADLSPPKGFRKSLELSPHPIALIAEVKKASPVRGVVRERFDPLGIATDYRSAGVDCLSVLTDVEFFQGSPDYLALCRDATGLPTLRKDFIIDAIQVYESRVLGADAILLIVNGLEEPRLIELSAVAKELGMDVLVEVHTEAEAVQAIEIAADLIGVNNRDLETFETRIETATDIIPMFKDHALVVSESALRTHEDVVRVGAAGARAVLIGTTLSKSEDIPAKVNEVMGW